MQTTLDIDHSLVARVQLLTTGATAHDIYQLLGCYYDLADSDANDIEAYDQLRRIEQRLRAFCVTGRVPPDSA